MPQSPESHPLDGHASPGFEDLPIFALSTVLFPGAVLPLRVFEPRYVDMVRERMTRGLPFGVCRITRGGEVGTPAEHEQVGCTARIDDFDMHEAGVLQLRTIGLERFEVLRSWIQPDGLIRAQARIIAADPLREIPPEHAPCVQIVRRLIEAARGAHPDPAQRLIAEPAQPGSAGWVANRLAERLPIDAQMRQALMALADPLERLARVHDILRTLRSD